MILHSQIKKTGKIPFEELNIIVTPFFKNFNSENVFLTYLPSRSSLPDKPWMAMHVFTVVQILWSKPAVGALALNRSRILRMTTALSRVPQLIAQQVVRQIRLQFSPVKNVASK